MLQPEAKSLVLDSTKATYFEQAIYSLFKVNVMDIISIKAQIQNTFHTDPTYIDKLPFWEFELYMEEIERLVKEESKRQEEEYNNSGARDAMKMARNPGKMMASINNSMPKAPSMNVPKVTMPSYH